MPDQVEGYYNVKTGRVVIRSKRNAATFDGMTDMKRVRLKRDPETNAWVPDGYLGETIDAAIANNISRIAEKIDTLNNQKGELLGLAEKIDGGKAYLENLGLWEDPIEKAAPDPIPEDEVILTEDPVEEEEEEDEKKEPVVPETPKPTGQQKKKTGGKLGLNPPNA